MKLEKWQQSELECVEYLKRTYGAAGVVFGHKGGSDSSQSDIQLLVNGMPRFYIEAKSAAAQCGQFVVLDENGTFVYSPKNKVQPASSFSRQYIDFMQANYNAYKSCGRGGVEFPSQFKSLAYNWVKDYYKHKKAAFVIVEKELGSLAPSNFVIFPLEKFDSYFDIVAKYRVKTSGSNNPHAGDKSEIGEVLRMNGYNVSQEGFEGSHYYVNCTGLANKKQLTGKTHRWQFNLEAAGKYQVRKLSNTNNANVIFEISLKPGVCQNPKDLELFKLSLK